MTRRDPFDFAQRLKTFVAGLRGWQRALLATVLGALAAGAMAPYYFIFLLVPAFSGLVWLLDGSRHRRAAFVVGWWFGFGHFTAGLYWVAYALLVDAERFGTLAPLAPVGMGAMLAFFPAALALAYPRILQGWGRVLVFAVLWTALEWVRSWAFTGFPWNLIGTVWTVSDQMIQLAALTGVYGLSLLTVAGCAMPAVLGDTDTGVRGRVLPLIAVGVVAGLVWAGGAHRLADADIGTVENVRLRIVQANIPQRLKWRADLKEKNFLDQVRMGQRGVGEAASQPTLPPTHIIWPETAAAFFIANDNVARTIVGRATPPGGLTILGAPRSEYGSGGARRVWNSMLAINDAGKVIATYDKSHLVPFGEYVPWRDYLPLNKITKGARDFSKGPGVRTIDLPGLPSVSPLICYEAIFPAQAVDANNPPGWILNLTNDAWYGNSAGPYQHFSAVRLRAVEEGMPLVRAANTGISGVIDSYGRVTARLGYHRRGIIDAALPKALEDRPLYARLGNRITLVLLMVTGLAGAFAGFRASLKSHRKALTSGPV